MPVVSGFLPSTSGLHFSNGSFSNVPLFTIEIFGERIPIGDAANGLCGGMVYAACDYFQAGMRPPTDNAPPSSGPLFDYLVNRLFDSFDFPHGLLMYLKLMNPTLPDHETPTGDTEHGQHSRASLMIRHHWPAIKADIDHNRLAPIGLVQVKSSNPFDLIKNHQVLVYGYDLDQTQLTLYVYDPNFPDNDDVRIHMDIGDPHRPMVITRTHDSWPIVCFFHTNYVFTQPPSLAPVPTCASDEQIWIDDCLPTGAIPGGDQENWHWTATDPAPRWGRVAHRSSKMEGLHQHYFSGASDALVVDVGDMLFADVYLDPDDPPSQLMLQWHDGSWEHRAYWGTNRIEWGVDGTAGRRFMGPLPPTGQWVRLHVPAAAIDLEGRSVNGMAFTLWGGSAAWDRAGKLAEHSADQSADDTAR